MEEAEYCNRIALIDHGQLIALGSPAELKRQNLTGRIYEVEISDVLKAAEILAGADQVLDAAVFGRALHVRLAQGVEAEGYLSHHLSPAGLVINRLKSIEPTLEDVFVALVGHGAEEKQ
jgi:ABC-2 type transport system ATP-binding protein